MHHTAMYQIAQPKNDPRYELKSEVYIVNTYHVSSKETYVSTTRFFHPEVVASHCNYHLVDKAPFDAEVGDKRNITVLRISIYQHKEFPDVIRTDEHWVEPLVPTKVIANHYDLPHQPSVTIANGTITPSF